jgi:copper chaperone
MALELTVTGMTCDHCVQTVTKAVAQVDGATAVRVDLESGRVSVDGSDVDRAAVDAAIADAGYGVAS